jgi:hypothetical protein
MPIEVALMLPHRHREAAVMLREFQSVPEWAEMVQAHEQLARVIEIRLVMHGGFLCGADEHRDLAQRAQRRGDHEMAQAHENLATVIERREARDGLN